LANYAVFGLDTHQASIFLIISQIFGQRFIDVSNFGSQVSNFLGQVCGLGQAKDLFFGGRSDFRSLFDSCIVGLIRRIVVENTLEHLAKLGRLGFAQLDLSHLIGNNRSQIKSGVDWGKYIIHGFGKSTLVLGLNQGGYHLKTGI